MKPLLALAALFALAIPASAQQDPPAWTRPTPAFHVVGSIWYVGTEGLAAYLIKTPAGAILIDGTMEENVPAIERNVAAAGVRMRDVRLLLNSHAHFDHAAGLARLKADSGARLVAGAGDRAALDAGLPPGEVSYGVIRFPAVRVDRGVRDGERVSLGGVTLTARATPGHTPGNTSWTMRVREGGRVLDVVFAGSLTVAGNTLAGNRRYPGIVADFRRSFDRVERMPADVVLPFHPEGADVIGRARRAVAGERGAWLAPGLLARMAREARVAFAAELARQEAGDRRGTKSRVVGRVVLRARRPQQSSTLPEPGIGRSCACPTTASLLRAALRLDSSLVRFGSSHRATRGGTCDSADRSGADACQVAPLLADQARRL